MPYEATKCMLAHASPPLTLTVMPHARRYVTARVEVVPPLALPQRPLGVQVPIWGGAARQEAAQGLNTNKRSGQSVR